MKQCDNTYCSLQQARGAFKQQLDTGEHDKAKASTGKVSLKLLCNNIAPGTVVPSGQTGTTINSRKPTWAWLLRKYLRDAFNLPASQTRSFPHTRTFPPLSVSLSSSLHTNIIMWRFIPQQTSLPSQWTTEISSLCKMFPWAACLKRLSFCQ